MGPSELLLAAELITVGCPVDGLRHLLDDQAHAEALAAYAEGRVSEPRFEALCGRVLVPDSLMADQRPVCPACAREATPRLRAAHERVARNLMPGQRVAHPIREMWARAASAGGAALVRLRDGAPAERRGASTHRSTYSCRVLVPGARLDREV